jgi:hypothetical protein
MRTPGQAMVWGTHIGGGRAQDGAGWYQQLRGWWAARKTARRQAQLAAIQGRWDAEREAVRPLCAEAAPEMAVAQNALSVATLLYGLTS